MQSLAHKTILWVLCLITLGIIAPASHSFAQSSVDSALSASRARDLVIEGYSFPREIVGMARSIVQRYGGDAGFSVRYSSPDKSTWADVYVYDESRDRSQRSETKNAAKEVSAALGEIDRMVSAGIYKQAQVLKRWNESGYDAASLRIEMKDQTVPSFLFVTVNRDKFVKIRLSSRSGSNAHLIASSFAKAYSRKLK
ncbi:hypothetical protein [Microvirga flavescens]|uniref:hypothetical protein n=1 Tax=Microvirga flavescens TaxID=2249811 RepID=UPI000DD67653|nr:hypothetical protein [Microvirga flavescens]